MVFAIYFTLYPYGSSHHFINSGNFRFPLLHPFNCVSDRSHSILATNANRFHKWLEHNDEEKEKVRENESQNLHCFRCFNGFHCDMKINWIDLTHILCTTCMCVCVRWKSHCYSIMYKKMKRNTLYHPNFHYFVRFHSRILLSHSLAFQEGKKREGKR